MVSGMQEQACKRDEATTGSWGLVMLVHAGALRPLSRSRDRQQRGIGSAEKPPAGTATETSCRSAAHLCHQKERLPAVQVAPVPQQRCLSGGRRGR